MSTAWAVVVGWIALVHAGLWWLYYRPATKSLWGDEKTYLESATRLLGGDPGWWPEPLWPPLYPQFVAGLMSFGGGSIVAVQLAQSALLAVTAVMLFDLTRRFTDSRAAGVVVAAMTLGYPTLVAFCHYLWPEVLHLFLFTALLWLLIARGSRTVWWAVAGGVLGLALLTKGLLLPFVPVLVVAAVWREPPAKAVARIVVIVVAAALTMAPVAVAQARYWGSCSIAGSSVFNLWVGLNDVGRESFEHDVVWPAYKSWVTSAPKPSERNRILRDRTVDLVTERGLGRVLQEQLSKQYFRLFDVDSYLTDQLPGGAAIEQARAGYRAASTRSSRVVRTTARVSYLLLLVAAPLGLIFGRCRSNRWVRVLLLFVVYNLALFLWLHVKTRYRIQMLPVAFIGVGCLVGWIEAGCCPRPSTTSVTATLLIVTVLLVLALS